MADAQCSVLHCNGAIELFDRLTYLLILTKQLINLLSE